MPRAVYDELARTGSSIGWRLRNAQRASIEALWARAASPAGDAAARKGLPARCDRAWFAATFCGGADDASRGPADTIWDLVDGFMQVSASTTDLKDRVSSHALASAKGLPRLSSHVHSNICCERPVPCLPFTSPSTSTSAGIGNVGGGGDYDGGGDDDDGG